MSNRKNIAMALVITSVVAIAGCGNHDNTSTTDTTGAGRADTMSTGAGTNGTSTMGDTAGMGTGSGTMDTSRNGMDTTGLAPGTNGTSMDTGEPVAPEPARVGADLYLRVRRVAPMLAHIQIQE